jgi:hypothetical protein
MKMRKRRWKKTKEKNLLEKSKKVGSSRKEDEENKPRMENGRFLCSC